MKSNRGLIITTALLVIGAVGFYLWKRNKDKQGSTDGTADVPSEAVAQVEDLKNKLIEAKSDPKLAAEIQKSLDEAMANLKKWKDIAKNRDMVTTTLRVGDPVVATSLLNAYFDTSFKKPYKPSFKEGEYLGAYIQKENSYVSRIKRKRSGFAITPTYDTLFVPTSKIKRG